MDFLEMVEKDGLGVVPTYARQLYVDMLDAAEALLDTDLARIRYAAAPLPMGAGKASEADQKAIQRKEQRGHRMSPAASEDHHEADSIRTPTNGDDDTDDEEDDAANGVDSMSLFLPGSRSSVNTEVTSSDDPHHRAAAT